MSPKGPPRTPGEMDALLAELRADPAKAARFRADLVEKTRNAFAKLGRLESPLHQLISEAFAFLVHEYGFTEHTEKMVGRFGATTLKEYSSEKVRISVGAGGFDNGSFCGIGFENTESGDRSGFELLSKRCPEFDHPQYGGTTEIVRSHLAMYAHALKKHAGDVLLGDFGAFLR
jgi:hypothetical protein